MSDPYLPSGRRAILSVPASDERKIAKALASGADEVVLDLEDAVAPGDKDRARAVIVGYDWTAASELPLIAVRINAPRTPWCHRDLEAIACADIPVASVVLPKAESRADVGFAERLIDGVAPGSRLVLQALVETARGLANLADIVSSPERLGALILGYADLGASLGRRGDFPDSGWDVAREQLLAAGRSADLEAVDGPWLGVDTDERFRRAVTASAARGFDAKWVIHPRQVATVAEAFTPSQEEIARAEATLAALEGGHARGVGAVQLDGALVDEAMAVAARRVLSRAQAAS